MRIISRDFYGRHPGVVARQLLGKILVRKIGAHTLTGRIVETEAYSSDDPASHAYRGRTERNRVLFGEVGHAYVYLSHGRHHCLNIVAKGGKPAGGVLIRALEPLHGMKLMRRFRGGKDDRGLARGPGNLTRALKIGMDLNGSDLTNRGPLFIVDDGFADFKVRRTGRIGVTEGRDKLRRFVVKHSRFISRPGARPKIS
ncbi:MAG: DNA-3-methyladenine glycosylase [Isosphaeraceae bacterium]